MGLPGANDIDGIHSTDEDAAAQVFVEFALPEVFGSYEAKHWRMSEREIERCERSAGRVYADLAGKPYFLIRYFVDTECGGSWSFTVYPINAKAHQMMPRGPRDCTERHFVQFLFELHGTKADPATLAKFATVKPPMRHDEFYRRV